MDGEDSRSLGLVQASDGLYTEVLLWHAIGPIARRWIVPTCVLRVAECKNVSSVLEDCHKRSCWKNCIEVSVPRPYRLNVYVCSKSC
jgi:hypothetical protein